MKTKRETKTNRLIKSVTIVGLLLSAGAGLSACGKKGDIKPPPSYQNSND